MFQIFIVLDESQNIVCLKFGKFQGYRLIAELLVKIAYVD